MSVKPDDVQQDNQQIVKDLEDALRRIEELHEFSKEKTEQIQSVKNKIESLTEEAEDQGRNLDQGNLNEAVKEGEDIFSKLRDVSEDIDNRAHELQIQFNILKSVHTDLKNASELEKDEEEKLRE